MKNSANKKYSEILNQNEFKIFLKETNNFFTLLEHNKPEDQLIFKTKLHLILSKIYSASFSIPDLELQFDNDFENDQFIIRNKDFTNQIMNKIGSCEWYYEVFDPYNLDDSDPMEHSLLDDIIDIYYELKIANIKIEKNIPEYIEDGIWDIIFGRNNHWGNHAVNAIRALHYNLYG